MIETSIVNGRILTPSGILLDSILSFYNGKITQIQKKKDFVQKTGQVVIDAKGLLVCSGYIDSHTHGAFGYDFSEANRAQCRHILRMLPTVGVTAVLATLGSSDLATTQQQLEILSDLRNSPADGARLLGVHLEGPYLNAEKRGAQLESVLRLPDLNEIKDLLSTFGDLIKMVTLAPELPGSMEMIHYLRGEGVAVSLGHSAASYAVAAQAIEIGATRITHFYNAMPPLHHRRPGLQGAGLLAPQVYVELIMDGQHVSPEALRIAHQAKGTNRIILVTDSTQATGLPDGQYVRPGDRVVYVREGSVRFESGLLAGSVLTMEQAVRNCVNFLHVPIEEAVQMAAGNPARNLGFDDWGEIAPDKMADFVILDSQYNVQMAFVDGKKIYDEESKGK